MSRNVSRHWGQCLVQCLGFRYKVALQKLATGNYLWNILTDRLSGNCTERMAKFVPKNILTAYWPNKHTPVPGNLPEPTGFTTMCSLLCCFHLKIQGNFWHRLKVLEAFNILSYSFYRCFKLSLQQGHNNTNMGFISVHRVRIKLYEPLKPWSQEMSSSILNNIKITRKTNC